MRKSIFLIVLSLVVAAAVAGLMWVVNVSPAQNQNKRQPVQNQSKPAGAVAAKNLTITVLYDNNPYKEGLETAWGFSCIVQGTEKTILFDTGGSSRMLLSNMQKVGVAPKQIDVVVLSHIHADHVGGLSGILEANPRLAVYLPASFPKSFKDRVKKSGATLYEVHVPLMICQNVHSTGELGGWIKEESLVIRTSKGLVLITGCAHPGIATIVKKAKSMLNAEVYLAMGGFHLCWMNTWQIGGIVSGVQKEGVKKVAPCHCSGNLARNAFQKVYGENCILAGVGKKVVINDAF